MSGSGRLANSPNRPGWSCRMDAAYSLHSRARRTDSSSSPNHSPGAEIEVTAVAIPWRSIASTDMSGVHSGVRPARISGPIRSSPTVAT